MLLARVRAGFHQDFVRLLFMPPVQTYNSPTGGSASGPAVSQSSGPNSLASEKTSQESRKLGTDFAKNLLDSARTTNLEKLSYSELANSLINNCPHTGAKETLKNFREHLRKEHGSPGDPSSQQADEEFIKKIGPVFLHAKGTTEMIFAWDAPTNHHSKYTWAQNRVTDLIKDRVIPVSCAYDPPNLTSHQAIHPDTRAALWKKETERNHAITETARQESEQKKALEQEQNKILGAYFKDPAAYNRLSASLRKPHQTPTVSVSGKSEYHDRTNPSPAQSAFTEKYSSAGIAQASRATSKIPTQETESRAIAKRIYNLVGNDSDPSTVLKTVNKLEPQQLEQVRKLTEAALERSSPSSPQHAKLKDMLTVIETRYLAGSKGYTAINELNDKLSQEYAAGKTDKLIQVRPNAYGKLVAEERLFFTEIKTDPVTGRPELGPNGSPKLTTVFPDIERAQKAILPDLDRLATRYPPHSTESSVSVTVRSNYRNVEEYLTKPESEQKEIIAKHRGSNPSKESFFEELLGSANRDLVGRTHPEISKKLDSSRELYYDMRSYLALRQVAREPQPEALDALKDKIKAHMTTLSNADKIGLCESLRKTAEAYDTSSPSSADRIRTEFLTPVEQSISLRPPANTSAETYLQTSYRYETYKSERAYRQKYPDNKMPSSTPDPDLQKFGINDALFSNFVKAGGNLQNLDSSFKAQLLATNPNGISDEWLKKVRALAETKDQKALDLVDAYQRAFTQTKNEKGVLVAVEGDKAVSAVQNLINSQDGVKHIASFLYRMQESGNSAAFNAVHNELRKDPEKMQALQTLINDKLQDPKASATIKGKLNTLSSTLAN